jgi:hypothetical protein
LVVAAYSMAWWLFADDEAHARGEVAAVAESADAAADEGSPPDEVRDDTPITVEASKPTQEVLVALEGARLELAIASAEAVTPTAESAVQLAELRSARRVVRDMESPDARP